MSSLQDTEAMLRFVSTVAAQLTPEQAEAAAADLREQAEAAGDPVVRKFLVEGAESLVALATDVREHPPAQSP